MNASKVIAILIILLSFSSIVSAYDDIYNGSPYTGRDTTNTIRTDQGPYGQRFNTTSEAFVAKQIVLNLTDLNIVPDPLGGTHYLRIRICDYWLGGGGGWPTAGDAGIGYALWNWADRGGFRYINFTSPDNELDLAPNSRYYISFEIYNTLGSFFYGYIPKGDTPGLVSDFSLKNGMSGTFANYLSTRLSFNITGIKLSVNNSAYGTGTTTNYSYIKLILPESGNRTWTVGYWLGNTVTTNASFEQNVTYDPALTEGTYQTSTNTNLLSGKFYHYRAWLSGHKYSFRNSTYLEGHFLTRPNPPTNLAVLSRNETNITLTWTKASTFEAGPRTVIVKSNTSYPLWTGSGWSNGGLVAYNGTASATQFNSSTENLYLTAYTYLERTEDGVPLCNYSSSYAYTFSSPTYVTYNVSVRWEHNDTLINLSDTKWIGNQTARFMDFDGTLNDILYPTSVTGQFSTTVNVSDKLEFVFNNTITRTIVVSGGFTGTTRNLTIYIPSGIFGYSVGNLLPVVIKFYDDSNEFTRAKHGIVGIYIYNATLKKYIHSDYLQADDSIRCYLKISNTYYVTVKSDTMDETFVGPLTIYDDEYDVIVYRKNVSSIDYSTIFDITYGRSGSTLYYDFFDTTSKVQNSKIRLYSNTSLLDTWSSANPFDFNYTKINSSEYRMLIHTVQYYDGTFWSNFTITRYYPVGTSVIVPHSNITDIDNDFEATLGHSPVTIAGIPVSYMALGAFAVVLMFLFVFSPAYAGFATIFCGLIIGFFKYIIDIFGNTINDTTVIVIIIIGILLYLVMKKRGET